jgi:hypothetical protein
LHGLEIRPKTGGSQVREAKTKGRQDKALAKIRWNKMEQDKAG